jgi:hypothetical protein
MAEKLAVPPIPADAARLYYPDAMVPGAFWYFTRELHPATYPASAFRLVAYIPPARKARP